jgi:hypothetical protein
MRVTMNWVLLAIFAVFAFVTTAAAFAANYNYGQ